MGYHTVMSRPILVSGAGIAGTTIAYWLLKRGFTPVLVERAPRFREGGYIIDLWGVGFDVAERMGLIACLRRQGYSFNRIESVAKDGTRRSALGGNRFERALGNRFSASTAATLPAKFTVCSRGRWRLFSAIASGISGRAPARR